MMAERVFSPKEAEPAPITVIFVGSVIVKFSGSRCQMAPTALISMIGFNHRKIN
jgi:hypothetical protein